MPTKKRKGERRLPGLAQANFQIPAPLHEAMKAIRQARHEQEGADVKLCRIYHEAVQQYVNAKPQQRLLNASKALRATG